MNGTVSATNFSLGGIGGGEGWGGGGGGGSALAKIGAGEGVADGEGAGAGLLLAEGDCLDPIGISSLVKYRNPATPMATRDTTVTANGHIQFGVAEAGTGGGFFLNCGVE